MSAPGEGRTIDALTMVLLIICLGLIAGVLVLGSQAIRLKKELGSHTIRSADQVDLSGLAFPSLKLRDSTGTPAPVELGRNGALLLVFSSDCPDCVATLPDWEELFIGDGGVESVPLPVYGIQLDMPPPSRTGSESGMVKAMPFPVFGPDGAAALRSFRRIPMIPAALALDADGRVIQAWIGRPTDATLEEIGALIRS